VHLEPGKRDGGRGRRSAEHEGADLGRYDQRRHACPRSGTSAAVRPPFADVTQRGADAAVQLASRLFDLGERQRVERRGEGVAVTGSERIVDRGTAPVRWTR
jgi:hypothetical protein